MSRPRVLLVDPDDSRRASFSRFLSSRFEVVAVALATRAVAEFSRLRPDAVLAHARQPLSSGMRLCKELRALPDGVGVLMVVYGHPVGPRPSASQAEQLRVASDVDVYLSREVDEMDLEQVVGLKLLAPPEAPRVPLPDLGTAAPSRVEFFSAHREEGLEDEASWGTALGEGGRDEYIRLLGRQYGPLIDRLPEDREVTWGELMRARANLHNIRVLLEKPVTPLVQALPKDRDPTMAEILRARLTLNNLKIILRRRLPRPPPPKEPS